jgi:drug/metabolite transporter (DMT)-like permease
VALSRERTGQIYVAAAILLWSTAEVVIRAIRSDIGPMQLALLRFALGALFLAPFLRAHMRRNTLRFTPRILFHSVWLSLIGIVGASICFQYALVHAGAGIVAAMLGATPLFVFVLARFMLGDPLTWPRFAGLVAGFIGILILGLSKESATFSLLGFGLAVLNSLFFALFTVLVKKLGGPFQGLPLTLLCFIFGTLWLVPLAAWETQALGLPDWGALWLPLLYLSIGTTGLAYLFFFLGLERSDATLTMSAILMKPPLAAVLAAVFLGEPITWNLAASLLFIIGGLYLVHTLNRLRARQ